MIELKNDCLHHISGGTDKWDPNCPGCNGEWDNEMPVSRETFVRIGSWVGRTAGTVASYVTGAKLFTSILAGNGAADFGGFIGGAIYDNPDIAIHPDYSSPAGNLINPYK